jgi:hypothetical protein
MVPAAGCIGGFCPSADSGGKELYRGEAFLPACNQLIKMAGKNRVSLGMMENAQPYRPAPIGEMGAISGVIDKV